MRPLQYVILRHEEIEHPHFDLMFETLPGSDLATWRSGCWPLQPATPLQRLKDHRRAFLSFQGQLTGGRGRVYPVAQGQCALTVGEDAVWTIKLLDDWAPQTLQLRQLAGEVWEGALLT